jgi:hypothetical protein
MSTKLKLSAVGLISAILLTGFWVSQSPPSQKNYDLAVIQIDGVWKVVNAADSTTVVKVKKNDKIVWTAEGTDAVFQFQDQIFDTTDGDYSLSQGFTEELRDGKKLKLKIKKDAPAGTYVYSVFCVTDSVYAIGSSPPKIIVE